jgi:hypothetical protein
MTYTVTSRTIGSKNGRKVYTALARFDLLAAAREYAAKVDGDVRLTCESRLHEEA